MIGKLGDLNLLSNSRVTDRARELIKPHDPIIDRIVKLMVYKVCRDEQKECYLEYREKGQLEVVRACIESIGSDEMAHVKIEDAA